MREIRSWMLAALASAALAACGGGGSADDAPPARATIVTAQLAGQATKAQIDAGTQSTGLQPLSGTAKCDVDIRYVLYITRDPAGQPATASAGVLVPSGTDAACTGGGTNQLPVLLYAHGTTTAKSKNMADVLHDSEASLEMAMFAAQGFIVVAPNYLGYDQSSLAYHPYLNAEAQAVDMIDGLRAAKVHLNAQSTNKPSDKLLIAGYSEGGHVAMATHKIIERDYSGEFTVTASGPMSGPHNLAKMTTQINSGPDYCSTVGSSNVNCTVNAGGTIFTPLLLTSYQRAYGDIYAKPSDAYQSPFDQYAETLFPTDTPLATLLQQGKLPADTTFTKLFGTGGLINESFRAAYFSDPNNTLKAAVTKNTLLGWTPKRPVALCGGANDPAVFFYNSTDLQADFATRGVQVPAFNLEDRATLPAGALGDAIYGGFQQQKTAAGTNATAQYHGTLVPPFCNALVRGYFQQVLASGL
jgi:predicted esterase